MKFELKTKHYLGITLGGFIILLDFIFFFDWLYNFSIKGWYFNPIFVLGVIVIILPFLIDFLNENKRQKELELQFLEWVRTLVTTVRSGVTLPLAIGRVSRSEFGALTPYVSKLAHQLEWGYSMHDAFTIFVKDTRNNVISRSVNIVMQAEKSGGDIASVLDSVTKSVLEIKKLKEERKANAYNQMVQGYIIFFVFIAIMLILQIYLVPKLTEIGFEVVGGLQGAMPGAISSVAGVGSVADLGPIFVAVILVQGLFTGLMIGKFSEGSIKAGVKHSVILVVVGYLLMSTFVGIFGLSLLLNEGVLRKCLKKV